MSRPGRRRSVLLLWSANGDMVAMFRDLRTNAPFIVHGGLRYVRIERQDQSASIVHYQTRTIMLRSIPNALVFTA